MAGGRSRKTRKRGTRKKAWFNWKKFWTRRRARIARVSAYILAIFAAGILVGVYSIKSEKDMLASNSESPVLSPAPLVKKSAPVLAREKGRQAQKLEKAPPPRPEPAPEPKALPTIAPPRPKSENRKVLASIPPLPHLSESRHGVAAIIIDDIGQSMEAVERLLAIGLPIAISVLPHQAYSRQAAIRAGEKGQVVMLHLPMEPRSKNNNPGQGALYSFHDGPTLRKLFAEDIQWVPGAVGVNNHMGSRLTEIGESMAPLMEEMRSRGLFFVDSKTSSASVASKVAQGMGVPWADRDVFLDNDRDVAKIIKALELLTARALKNGVAVGIGHPYPETIRALEIYAPKMAAQGVALAPVTKLLQVGSEGGGARASHGEASCVGNAC